MLSEVSKFNNQHFGVRRFFAAFVSSMLRNEKNKSGEKAPHSKGLYIRPFLALTIGPWRITR